MNAGNSRRLGHLAAKAYNVFTAGSATVHRLQHGAFRFDARTLPHTNLASMQARTFASASSLRGRSCGLPSAASAALVKPAPHYSRALGAVSATIAGHLSSRTMGRQVGLPALHVRGYAAGYKMKGISALKLRFRKKADGTFKHQQCGRKHLASSKSKKRRMRLRQQGLAPPGRARIWKKIGFEG